VSDLSDFKFSVPIEVRFNELDAMGHVNNAVYLTYFEVARNAFWLSLRGGNSYRDLNFIVVHTECDYRSPANFGEVLDVFVRIAEMKNSSFVVEYQIIERRSKRIVASGRTVQALYDYDEQRVLPIPDDLRQSVSAFEDVVNAPGKVKKKAESPQSHGVTEKSRDQNQS
jgi:acyl-CoA thioester hydrolase